MAFSKKYYRVNINCLDQSRIQFGCNNRHPNKNSLSNTGGLLLFQVTLNLELEKK